jgi:beta-glucanase (GH16 family)
MLETADGTSCLSDPANWNSSATTMQPCNSAANNEVFQNSIISTTASSGTGGSTSGAVGNVTVLPASEPSQFAPPGATINIGTNFTAVSPLSAAYSLTVYLTDSAGNTVTSVTDTLGEYDSAVPTTQWQGPITIVRSLQVPSVANGTYQVMVSLNDGSTNQPIALSAAPGVTQDKQYRSAIGTVTVQASAPAPSLLAPQTLNLTGFTLTFDDEFQTLDLSDGFVYNGSKWYTHNEQCCMQTTDGSGTFMYGMDDPEDPYSIAPGVGLDIRLQEVNHNWSSGVMTSVDNFGVGFSQQYGYFEMSAKFPSGLDTWPAFWMLNTASKATGAAQGEIDVVEYIANPAFINTIRATLHDWSNNTAPDFTWNQVTNPSDGNFHTYGLLWTAQTMTFYFDGTVFFACPTPTIMQQPYYMLVDLGIGSGYPTNTTPAVNDMIVQYVRAYALPPSQ